MVLAAQLTGESDWEKFRRDDCEQLNDIVDREQSNISEALGDYNYFNKLKSPEGRSELRGLIEEYSDEIFYQFELDELDEKR